MTMELTVFLPSLAGGGAERALLTIAGGLAARGHDVELVTARPGGPLRDQVPGTVELVELGCGRTRHAIPHLVRRLKTLRPTALLTGMDHGNSAAVLANILARRKTRTIVTYHMHLSTAAREGQRTIQRLRPAVARQTMARADHVVAVSRGVAADLLAISPAIRDRLQVIYNPTIRPQLFELAAHPVTLDWFDQGLSVIVAAGRLTDQKGFDVLIEAFQHVVRQRPDARLLILGEGPRRRDLERTVGDRQLDSLVRLPGYVTNPYPFFKRARLFVLSSRREGLPTVLVEAAALGTPVVATDCPSGPRELLAGRCPNALVRPDDANALAAAVALELSRPQSAPASDEWHEHTIDACLDSYQELLVGVR